jgi:hypothetical protein
MRTWIRSAAWLCLSLMLWMAALESAHNHPNQTEAASCAICIAAHCASPTLISAHSTPAFVTVGVLHEEAIVASARIESSDLDIRGPPILL